MKKIIFMLALLASFALTTKSFAVDFVPSIEAKIAPEIGDIGRDSGDEGREIPVIVTPEADEKTSSDTGATSSQNVKNRPFTPAEAADVINNSDKNSVTINF